MQKRYRKFVLAMYRKFRHPRVLKQNRFRRWFARHFLDKTVWKPTRHTFAGGVAVGAFAMMLVIPGQMGLAFVLAALLRVNIPIAMLVTWITNPVTMPPVAWWEIEFGNWVITALGLGNPPPLGWHDLKEMLGQIMNDYTRYRDVLAHFKPWVASLYVGAVLLGLIIAPVCYALSYMFWDVILMLTHRRVRPDPPPPDAGNAT
jgi:uncharacterized protein (DUF2062 family)